MLPPSAAIPAIQRLQTRALDRTTTGIGLYLSYCLYIPSFSWKFPLVYDFTVRLFIQGMQRFEIKAGTMEVGLLTVLHSADLPLAFFLWHTLYSQMLPFTHHVFSSGLHLARPSNIFWWFISYTCSCFMRVHI